MIARRQSTLGHGHPQQRAATPTVWRPAAVSMAWRPGFREAAGQIEQVALSRNGRYLACALGGGGGIVMDVEGDERTRKIETPEGPAHVRCVAFAADSQWIIAAVGSYVQAHHFSTGRYERLQTLKGQATAVSVSSCGKYLAVGEDLGPDKHGHVWLHDRASRLHSRTWSAPARSNLNT